MADNSGDYFRFQIHHILAREIYAGAVGDFLNSIAITVTEKRGPKPKRQKRVN